MKLPEVCGSAKAAEATPRKKRENYRHSEMKEDTEVDIDKARELINRFGLSQAKDIATAMRISVARAKTLAQRVDSCREND